MLPPIKKADYTSLLHQAGIKNANSMEETDQPSSVQEEGCILNDGA